ncbi:MAG: hypothetical protein A4E55_01911 [Pelotomaculum sp. PtaU1.Bin035]|nr:MAG: hypothetical protein A4E55_01911 [Pelotomaculum sp. PtaU1.Bin035]
MGNKRPLRVGSIIGILSKGLFFNFVLAYILYGGYIDEPNYLP